MIILIVLCLFTASVSAQTPAMSTRYWDCCKPSCSWPGKAAFSKPVNQCAKDGVTVLYDNSAVDACSGTGGSAYICANQQPFNATATVAYGYVAANLAGQFESTLCCACFALAFTSAPLVGKTMVVQVINSGSYIAVGFFSLLIPGGGFGLLNGCQYQYPGTNATAWGSPNTGVMSRAQCSQLPAQLVAGCQFRFDWFQNANNPNLNYRRVKCPTRITGITGCVRSDDNQYPSV